MTIDFDQAHRQFIAYHKERRHGQRLQRLQAGHGHAEQLFLKTVWWPAFYNFRYLHPEYELTDYDGRQRFIDFAYLRDHIRLAIEIDGYTAHVSKQSRWQFADRCRRQNYLIIDGWSVLRFSYDDVRDFPRHCQAAIQQFLGRWHGEDQMRDLNFQERAIIQFAWRQKRPFTPGQISNLLGAGRHVTGKLLRGLVERGWLEPASGKVRIRSYRLSRKLMMN